MNTGRCVQKHACSHTPRYLYQTLCFLFALFLALLLIGPAPRAEGLEISGDLNPGPPLCSDQGSITGECACSDGRIVELLFEGSFTGTPSCRCPDGRTLASSSIGDCCTTCFTQVFRDCNGVAADGFTRLFPQDRIIQYSSFGMTVAESQDFELFDALLTLENHAINTVLETHQLPDSNRNRVRDFGRDSVRAVLFAELLAIIETEPAQRTVKAQAIVDAYAEEVRLRREEAADFALAEFAKWEQQQCGYQPPPGFTYSEADSPICQGLAPVGLPAPQVLRNFSRMVLRTPVTRSICTRRRSLSHQARRAPSDSLSQRQPPA